MSAPNTVGTVCVKEENTKEWICACTNCSLLTSESIVEAFKFLDKKFPTKEK